MRHVLLPDSLGPLIALPPSTCVVLPTPGLAMPAEAPTLREDSSASEVLTHPGMRDKGGPLFGGEWIPARLAFGAPAFFPASFSLRMIRIAVQDLFAVPGCVPRARTTHRGLPFRLQDGARLMARLDEAGSCDYYDHGSGTRATTVSRSTLDGEREAVGATNHKSAPGDARASW